MWLGLTDCVLIVLIDLLQMRCMLFLSVMLYAADAIVLLGPCEIELFPRAFKFGRGP